MDQVEYLITVFVHIFLFTKKYTKTPKVPTLPGKLTGDTKSVFARQFAWKFLKFLTLR